MSELSDQVATHRAVSERLRGSRNFSVAKLPRHLRDDNVRRAEMDEAQRLISGLTGAVDDLATRCARLEGALAIETAVALPSPFAWKRILAEVASDHGLTPTQLRGRQRRRDIAVARHDLFYRLSKMTTLSLPKIGKLVGGDRPFDHTTVMHGIKQTELRLAARRAG